MFSQGWYMPSVTQLSRITMMLILSNHVLTELGLRITAAEEKHSHIHPHTHTDSVWAVVTRQRMSLGG